VMQTTTRAILVQLSESLLRAVAAARMKTTQAVGLARAELVQTQEAAITAATDRLHTERLQVLRRRLLRWAGS
jgi:hypothetical protein